MKNRFLNMEAIGFQRTDFFAELTECMERVLLQNNGEKLYAQVLESSSVRAMVKLIRDRFDMNFDFYAERQGDAGITWRHQNANHVFMPNEWRGSKLFQGVYDNLKDKKKTVQFGSVDLKNAKLSGYFSEILFQMVADLNFMTRGMIAGQILSPAELAAIICHELGHGFTYCELFGRAASTNMVLDYLSKKRAEADPKELKVAYVVAKDALDLTADQMTAFEKASTQEELNTLFALTFTASIRSELGLDFYDSVACEQMADQFCVRLGGGKAFLSGLQATTGFTTFGRVESKHDWARTVLTGVFVATSFLVTFKVLLPFYLIAVGACLHQGVTSDTNRQIYDDGRFRPQRILQDLIERLKDSTLSTAEKKELIETIEEYRTKLEEPAYELTLTDHLKLLLNSRHREKINYEALQKQLEAIASNHLFVKAAKFDVLADQSQS